MLEITSPDLMRTTVQYTADGRPTDRNKHALRDIRQAGNETRNRTLSTGAAAVIARTIRLVRTTVQRQPNRA